MFILQSKDIVVCAVMTVMVAESHKETGLDLQSMKVPKMLLDKVTTNGD